MLRPHTPSVSKSSCLFCAVKSPRCLLVRASSTGAAAPNPKSLPRLLVSHTSKPGEVRDSPPPPPNGATGPQAGERACSSVRALGKLDRVLFVRAFHRHYSSNGVGGEAAGFSNVLVPFSSPHECFVFGCWHWEKKGQISTRSESFHTLFLPETHTGWTVRCSLQGWEFPLSVFICW